MALVVGGLVLGLMALMTPWFTIDVFQGGEHDPVVDFTTTAIVAHDPDGSYAVMPYSANGCRCATVAGAFDLMLIMVGAAVILGAAVGVAMRWGIVRGDMLVALAAVVAALLLLAPIILAFQLPGAFAADRVYSFGSQSSNWQSSFIGTNNTQSSLVLSWGPSAGWVLSLLGGVLVFAGVVLSRRRPRPAGVAHAPPAMAPPPATTPQAPAAPAPAAPVAPPAGGDSGGAFPSPSVGVEPPKSGGQ